MLTILLAWLLSLTASADHVAVSRGDTITVTLSVSSPNGAHVELLKNDAYTVISGDIDHGACGFSGCLAAPGTAVMTETIQIADAAPLGSLMLTALASTTDGSYVTATVQLEVGVSDPQFTAHWQSPTAARISWQQPSNITTTCLSRNATLIRCWSDLPAGPAVVELGKTGPLDGHFRPQAGDVFLLQQDGVVARAPLRSVVLLPLIR